MKGTDVQHHQPQQQHPQGQAIHHQQSYSNQHQHHQHQDIIGEAPMDLDESAGHEPVSAPLYTRSSSNSSSQMANTGSGHHLPFGKSNLSHVSSHEGPPSQPPLQPWVRPPFHQNQMDKVLIMSHSKQQRLILSFIFQIPAQSPITSEEGSYGLQSHNNWTHNQPPLDLGSLNNRGKQYYTPKDTRRTQSYQEEEDAYEEDLGMFYENLFLCFPTFGNKFLITKSI